MSKASRSSPAAAPLATAPEPAAPPPLSLAASRPFMGSAQGRIALPPGMFSSLTYDPDSYCMLLEGRCLEPAIPDGSMVFVSPALPVMAGMFVSIAFRDERQPMVKQLVALPPADLLRAIANGTSMAAAAVLVAMLNPPQAFTLSYTDLLAVHAIAGHLPPGQFEHLRRPMPRKASRRAVAS